MRVGVREPCDVIITNSHQIYINGVQIGGVMAFDMDIKPAGLTNLTLRLHPTSVVYGDPPIMAAETPAEVQRMNIDQRVTKVRKPFRER